MSVSVPSDDPEPVSDESASLLTVLSGTAVHAPFGNFLGSPATAAPPYVPSPPRAQKRASQDSSPASASAAPAPGDHRTRSARLLLASTES